ncbi:MAG: hypothetical protein RLZZ91_1678 [Bacteroidota bacterium]
MNRMKKLLVFSALLAFALGVQAQGDPKKPGQLHGNFQFLSQQYSEDSLIGATVPPATTAINGFGNLMYTQGGFSAGMRFETYNNAIQGFSAQNRYKGTGIGNRFVQYQDSIFNVTIGNFYEQFGNGLTLRTYWEPNLGIDNALDGARLIITPKKGITLKGIYGRQRLDFDSRSTNADGIIRGTDAEFNLNSIFKSLAEKQTQLTLGGSFVSRYQNGETRFQDSLIFLTPNNVSSSAVRLQLNRNAIAVSAEYAEKINDPSADNAYLYRKGKAFFLNASYSGSGLGVNAAVKYIDNMSFRADRNLKLFDVPTNYLPSITKQHTYNLAATLYPYATPLTGEVSFMGEVFYTFKKGTKLGGKYGTQISANFAAANGLDTTRLSGIEAYTEGYEINSVKFGPTKYVRDFNLEVKKKLSKKFSTGFTYYYFEFNTLVTPVTNDFKGIVYANIEVLEMNYKFTPKDNLHLELQGLQTDQDKGDWATVVAEFSHSPHWSIGLIDQYNYGNSVAEKRIHYLFGTVGYINGSQRLTLGYGKRREGVFCIGGVCRAVPATNGFELMYTASF